MAQGQGPAADEMAADAEALKPELKGILHVFIELAAVISLHQRGEDRVLTQHAAAQEHYFRRVGIGQQVDGNGGILYDLGDEGHRKGISPLEIIKEALHVDVGIDGAGLGQNGPLGQVGLEAAHFAALTDLARRIEDDVADLPGHILSSPIDLSVEDHRRADTISDAQHHHAPAAGAGAEVVFRQSDGLGVVLQNKFISRQTAVEILGDRHIPPAEVGRKLQLSPVDIHNSGDYHPDGGAHLPVSVLLQESLQACRHPGQDLLRGEFPLGHRLHLMGPKASPGVHQAQVQIFPLQADAGAEEPLPLQREHPGRTSHLVAVLLFLLPQHAAGHQLVHDASHRHDAHTGGFRRLCPGHLPCVADGCKHQFGVISVHQCAIHLFSRNHIPPSLPFIT